MSSNKLSNRFEHHRCATSNTNQHDTAEHNRLPPDFDETLESFKIMNERHHILYVKLTEDTLITNYCQHFNTKYTNMSIFESLL